MAEPFQFELVSPEKLLISEEVEEVVVPGTEGDFGVLKGHAPFMSTIRPGYLSVKKVGGNVEEIFIYGGFADTGPGGLTVLAEHAVPAAELDREGIAQSIRDAEEDVADAKDDVIKAARARKLEQLRDIEMALKK
ncbi:F-type H+-transporting ATPase subunit epsilon [Rhodobium orientis]|uniref:ATP synthase epsilon chain n=1 Tax=Rhodobium orientis TaxID=34017 RepID=A0A327JS75_9HYPH|nr:F0F1 ATP synthase subunit epsilon [Rhodobium orientis]MBB4304549.1 F-type H+-transporting ATPase subunit epsilon [Rhodobium orientis]MBK5948140.1 F0F1 ATP synthase subunit epsilon [Rhodobium orientis]RAI26218.1 F0F1 ATP synthase subunit epsilon [Rhodobium orientis]